MTNHANFHAWEQRIHEGRNWIADPQPLTGLSPVSEHLGADGFEMAMLQPPVPRRLFHGTTAQNFPAFAVAGQFPSPGTKRKVGKETEEPQPAGRRQADVVEVNDSDAEGEENGNNQWTDAEVRQLIAFRSEMAMTFQKNFLKNDGRTWNKLHTRMVALCPGFKKSSVVYKKKWETVFSQYGVEKRLLLISGELPEVRSKFFDEIDKGFSNSATVRKFVHSDARGSPNPCPVDAGTMPINTATPSRKRRR